MLARTLRLTPLILTCTALLAVAGRANGQVGSPPAVPATIDVVESAFIFPKQQQEHVHSSSIVELPDGGLLAAWFQGSGERNADDVRIMGARKPAGIAEWSEPFLLADTPDHPDCNPVLWIDNDQRLWLFWSAILSNDWNSSLVKYRISTDYMADDGPPQWDWQCTVHVKPDDFHRHMLSGWKQLAATTLYVPRAISAELSVASPWELFADKWPLLLSIVLAIAAPWGLHAWRSRRTGRRGWRRFILRAGALYGALLFIAATCVMGYFSLQSRGKLNQRLGWLTANKPVQYASGEIVLPLYSDRFVASIMAISADGGATWQASEPLVGYGNIQPSLMQCDDGRLVAWMREAGTRKRIRSSVSADRGRTWSPVKESALPNPGAKVAVTELASGDWVVAYNPLVDGRHALALAISADEGDTWRPLHVLEDTAPPFHAYSYPSLLQTSDGRIHVTYSYRERRIRPAFKSIKHVTLDVPQLAQEAPPSPDQPVMRR